MGRHDLQQQRCNILRFELIHIKLIRAVKPHLQKMRKSEQKPALWVHLAKLSVS